MRETAKGIMVSVKSRYLSKFINVVLIAGWFVPLSLELHQLGWISLAEIGLSELAFLTAWVTVSGIAAWLLPDWVRILNDIRLIGVETFRRVQFLASKDDPSQKPLERVEIRTGVKNKRG